MAIVYDGKKASGELLDDLKRKAKTNIKLAIILIGEDKASKIYINLKRKAAEYVGFSVDVFEFPDNVLVKEVENKILELNSDKNVTGIMLQLPLPDVAKKHTQDLINLIDIKKDVDGLSANSKFIPATVKAILKIIKLLEDEKKISVNSSVAIVGYKGQVGKNILSKLEKKFINIIKLDEGDELNNLLSADIVVSATGKPEIIKPEFLKQDSVLIDVGAPKPEFAEGCYKKALFYTPVPGGVGPMTVSCLIENLLEALEK